MAVAATLALLAGACGGGDETTEDDPAGATSGGDQVDEGAEELDYASLGLWDDGPCEESLEP
ncbi:MAG TPA: hypothetical protein VIR30_00005, partial [Nocardioides sp.]